MNRDRQADNYGGVRIHIKDIKHSHQRTDLELPNIECIWVEVNFYNGKFLLGTFYRLPNSSDQTLSPIEVPIGLAIDSNIKGVFVTGKCNLDTIQGTINNNICQYFS